MDLKHCNDKWQNEGLESNGGLLASYCKSCEDKQGQESVKQDAMSLESTPSVSLSSSESFASTSSEFSVDLNPRFRNSQEEGTSDSEFRNFRQNGHIWNSNPATIEKGFDKSSSVVENSKVKNEVVDLAYQARDVEILTTDSGQEARDKAIGSIGGSFNDRSQGAAVSHSMASELDAEIWEPPEPEDLDDDTEGSVANYDDDDECSDGTNWGKPSCLSRFGDAGSYSFKEEKQRAMEVVMNGKFKTLVGQLLKSVGVAPSGDNNENWVDVVTSLSWEAASFVKSDSSESKAMDPDGYVKVKCIASGSRSQSQVIKGLVFKKHAAHKHMPTSCKNPRLLLLRGMLGQSSNGLSSFDLMEQEKNSLKSVVDMIEVCNPNLVLVEKTVSRDMQEFFLKKGMTLVFDMKLHRLERVARCTASSILPSDALMGQKLKQCDNFHFQKFIEEHSASGEAGKKPSKTLMFLEGCPTRLGCTILLKGSHSDELKKIKCVVQCAFVMAYHLILETSFLSDQKAMLCTIPFIGMSIFPSDRSTFVGSVNSDGYCLDKPSSRPASPRAIEIPISGSENLGREGSSTVFCEPFNPVILSDLSLQASLKKVIGDSFPRSSTSYQSLSSYLGLNGREQGHQFSTNLPVVTSPEASDLSDMEPKCNSDEENATANDSSFSVNWEAPLDPRKPCACNEDQVQCKDEIGTVLDSQSILVLMSSRNVSRGAPCEQIHFSHIKFYKNFDVPLGKFLRDNLLNQRNLCMTCDEPPESHFYYYAHHNRQLTIQVKRLVGKCLPGEAEGKLWMWSRCSKCKSGNGSLKSSKRVLISIATRGLSFGKFLEISFSPSPLLKASRCGHSLNGDFLYFFGLGSMIAMFRYSPVVTYTVSVPPQKLEFSNSARTGWLNEEIENVQKKGMLLFMEVENSLQKLVSKFSGLKRFPHVEELLRRERLEFEVNIKSVKNQNPDKAVFRLLSLNWLLWEVLLESCIWDRRIHLLLSSDSTVDGTSSMQEAMQGESNSKEVDVTCQGIDIKATSVELLADSAEVNTKLEESLKNGFSVKDIPVDGPAQEFRDQVIEMPALEKLKPSDSVYQGSLVRQCVIAQPHSDAENCSGENFPRYSNSETERNIPFIADIGKSVSNVSLNASQNGSLSLLLSNDENPKKYLWTPFSDIRRSCIKDLQRGRFPKFEPIDRQTAGYLPVIHQLISQEGSRLHVYLGIDDFMVSDFVGELSSIIACAVASLRDSVVATKGTDVPSRREARTTENSQDISRIDYVTSPETVDSDGAYSAQTVSLEEFRFCSFDGFNLLSTLASSGALHPEVSLGVGKLPGKGKYSVVCFYANQFYDLRNRCCPSEVEYVASLSRCKHWDAKGGKSKSFFAKTLDDRFIIKEIKKTEIDSFTKFAPDYFKYMNHSFNTGSQTCLAKILGIYQVKLMKSGKEVKHDLMVMENLMFGRSITRQYDLKGALHARFNSAADSSGDDVLLDQNFVNDMNASPLYVSNKAKRLLQRAVWNDTTFLHSINVMDYSLLVGVDRQRQELVCGIIDYLRQYTWDKQLETWVKSSLVVPKNLMPTIISPLEYKKRFRKFMSLHFLSVPDHWCSERSSDPCPLCNSGDEGFSQNQVPKAS